MPCNQTLQLSAWIICVQQSITSLPHLLFMGDRNHLLFQRPTIKLNHFRLRKQIFLLALSMNVSQTRRQPVQEHQSKILKILIQIGKLYLKYISLYLIRYVILIYNHNLIRMAKGGRSGGHHGRSHGLGHNHGIGHNHFGHHGHEHRHHFSHHSHRCVRSSEPSFETIMDTLHSNETPPSLIKGFYTFKGSEMFFRTHLQISLQPTSQPQMNLTQMQMMPGMQFPMNKIQIMPGVQTTTLPPVQSGAIEESNTLSVQRAHITLVGDKTKPSSTGCLIMTFMFACLIFPIFFMCCSWWKKIVNPMYELTAQAYHLIGDFIRANPNITFLNLTVVDNSFSAEKGRILATALGDSRITEIIFANSAIALNGDQNELDELAANVQPIKSLNLTSNIIWGDVIV